MFGKRKHHHHAHHHHKPHGIVGGILGALKVASDVSHIVSGASHHHSTTRYKTSYSNKNYTTSSSYNYNTTDSYDEDEKDTRTKEEIFESLKKQPKEKEEKVETKIEKKEEPKITSEVKNEAKTQEQTTQVNKDVIPKVDNSINLSKSTLNKSTKYPAKIPLFGFLDNPKPKPIETKQPINMNNVFNSNEPNIYSSKNGIYDNNTNQNPQISDPKGQNQIYSSKNGIYDNNTNQNKPILDPKGQAQIFSSKNDIYDNTNQNPQLSEPKVGPPIYSQFQPTLEQQINSNYIPNNSQNDLPSQEQVQSTNNFQNDFPSQNEIQSPPPNYNQFPTQAQINIQAPQQNPIQPNQPASIYGQNPIHNTQNVLDKLSKMYPTNYYQPNQNNNIYNNINNNNNIYNNINQNPNPFYKKRTIYDALREENNGNNYQPNNIYSSFNNNINPGQGNNFENPMDLPSLNEVNKK